MVEEFRFRGLTQHPNMKLKLILKPVFMSIRIAKP